MNVLRAACWWWLRCRNAGFLGLILVEWDWPIQTAERLSPLAFSSAMAQHTPPQPDEHINLELEDSAIDDTGAQSAAAAAAAALVALPQPPAAAAADAGQSHAVMAALPPLTTAATHTIQCPCVLRMLLCRYHAGATWRRPAQGLGRPAGLRGLRQAAQSLQGQAAQQRGGQDLSKLLQQGSQPVVCCPPRSFRLSCRLPAFAQAPRRVRSR